MMNNLSELYDAILVGELGDIVKVTKITVEEGMTPREVVNQYMIRAMEEIGNHFEADKIFTLNLLINARAIHGALDVLKPLIQGQVDSYIGRIVVGIVKGGLHDIGKNPVVSMFEGYDFEAINLGVDVSNGKFTSTTLENKADIIRTSALLTTTMNYMKEVVAAAEASKLKGKTKIMAGGVPMSDAFAKTIGVDAHTSSANVTIIVARELVAVN